MSLTGALMEDVQAEQVKEASADLERVFQTMSKEELKRFLKVKTAQDTQQEKQIGGLGKHIGVAAATGAGLGGVGMESLIRGLDRKAIQRGDLPLQKFVAADLQRKGYGLDKALRAAKRLRVRMPAGVAAMGAAALAPLGVGAYAVRKALEDRRRAKGE